ncbi:MAG: signal peptide peptidase SppA [Bdellovibrionales bacterium]|nr:signal peptide peptidase SppA [Bdellovibrionales bacterium]
MALTRKKKLLFGAIFLLACGAVFVSILRSTQKALSHLLEDDGDYSAESNFDKDGNLAVVDISGVIMDSRSTLKTLRDVRDSKGIKAVVVRINSPGGAVGPSQEIFAAVRELKKTKAVVCSLGDIAASGGYYIAAGCPTIVANPGTLTGSIGVIMHFINLKDLYNWAKVEPYILKAGHFKDIGSEMRPMTDEERKLMQALLDNVHAQFKHAVEEGRGFKPGYMDTYGDGRIFTGETAKELGLVDVLGGEDDAIQLAAAKAGIKDKPKIVREKTARGLRRLLDSDSQFQGQNPETQFVHLAAKLLPQLQLMPGVPYLLPAHMFSQSGGAR